MRKNLLFLLFLAMAGVSVQQGMAMEINTWEEALNTQINMLNTKREVTKEIEKLQEQKRKLLEEMLYLQKKESYKIFAKPLK